MTVTDAAPAARRSSNLLPVSRRDVRVRVIAWLNLIGNVVIIGTGGAVRLTGSGLGCSTWPMCTDSSWVPTEEDGLHGVIEFGNRLMSPVLAILAILAILAVWRFRQERRDLWIHAWIIGSGIIIQAIVGGIIVLTGLNSWIVGTHYIASAALVGVSASMILRAGRDLGPRENAVPGWMVGMTHLATLLLLAVVVGGVITTANGPHSGDAEVIRDSTAWEALTHVHAWLGYALVAVLVILLIGAVASRQRRYLAAVLAVILVVAVQVVVGVMQARLGLPPLLVGIHMVLAGVTVALTVVLVDAVKRRAVASR